MQTITRALSDQQDAAPRRGVRVTAAIDERLLRMIAVAAIGYGVRAAIIAIYPAMFGGDPPLRLANADRVLLAHWLPLPQLLVYLIAPIAPGPTLIRHTMALIGALAGVVFYCLLRRVVPERTAFIGSLFFTTNPMVLTYSTIPFQEIVQVLGLLGAFLGASTRRWRIAAAFLAIACLARYESWLACPVLAAMYAADHRWSVRHLAQAIGLFAVVPLLWILYHRGITPEGSVALDLSLTTARLARWRYLAYVVAVTTALVPLLLAPVGLFVAWRQRLLRDPGLMALCAYVVLFLLAIPFSLHGSAPDFERYVAAREAHMLLVGTAAFGAVGLLAVPARSRWSFQIPFSYH